MNQFASRFLQTLHERGFIHQQTNAEGLDQYLAECEKGGKPGVAYIGFDCTAKSLHVGSLLQIMALRWFQQCGHKPIVLLGGGTTKIGDPSGKDESRKMLSDDDIEANKQAIKKNFENFLTFEDQFDASNSHAVLVDNAEWIDNLNYPKFLREVGRHFSVNRMLTMDSVRLRLERESHLSFLEFNYMILQSYDFTVLNNNYGCRLQIGGSDQYGNIVMGTGLNRSLVAEANPGNQESADGLFGLTTPLITTSSGAKMGKTADGAVWLNGDMLSSYDYWQFWRNTEDADVGRFLRFFTDLPLEKITELESLEGAEINEAKKALATETTALLHGSQSARDALTTAEQTFEQGKLGEHLPEVAISKADLEAGVAAFKLFLEAGLAGSGKEARNLIRGGGARVNDEKVADENQQISMLDITEHGVIKLSAGKKKHVLVKAA